MSSLDKIAVVVEGAPTEPLRGNALPLLHEIRHAIEKLLEEGEPTVLDLRSIPMGPGDEERLFDALGRGEIAVELESLGKSHIWETSYPGVWVVEHHNTTGEVAGKFVEVCRVPEIVRAQEEDLRMGLERIRERLAAVGED